MRASRIIFFILLGVTTPMFAGLNRWTSSGPEGAAITSLAAESVIYAGTTGGGVFRSTTNGEPDWQPFNTGLTDLMITALAIDGDVVYAGTSSGRLFRSVNEGAWSESGKPPGGIVYEFAVDQQRHTVYAAAGVAGLLRSRNRGETWEVVPGLTQWATDVILTGDGTLYALMGSLLQVSIDGGVTWGAAGNGSKWSIAADAQSTVYTIDNGRVVFSTDYGKIWQPLPALVPYANSLFPRPGGVYAATTGALYAFDVGGSAWTRVSDLLSTQVNALTSSGPQLFAGTNGGVLTGTADNPEWRTANRGLNVLPVADVASSGTSTAYAATDGGLFQTSNGGTEWRKVLNEPVKEVETDGGDLIKVSGEGVRSSADAGQTWELVTPRITPALAITNASPATLYAAFNDGIAKSTDGGRLWQTISNGLDYPYGWWFYGLDVIVTETDDSIAARAYVAYEAGLFKTDDYGQHWDLILGAAKQYNEIPAVAARGEIVHASQKSGVRTSTDGGATWAATPRLSDERVSSLIIDPADPARAYAGTASGRVYRTDDFGNEWEPFGEGLRSASINRLDINAEGDRIYAATSAGLFEYHIGASIPIERLPDDPLRLPELIRGLLAGVRERAGADAAAGSSAAFVLPAVGTVRGYGGTTFRTDVTLSNDRGTAQSVILAWLPQGNLEGPSIPTFRLTLPPSLGEGGTLSISDLADELRLDGLGSVIVFATDASGNPDSAGSIFGFARVRSAAACGPGSVSQSVSAVSSQSFAAHARGRALGLRHDSANRTNVGIVNLGESAQGFTVVVDGQRTAERFTIVVPPFAPLQVPVPDRNYGGVTLTIISAGNEPWAAYGSSVDNNSRDGWTSQVLPLP
jgi:photosystem II stability/assembly factor-like uncharacterized protein